MPYMRTFQTMRNTMQAGRINVVSQVRGAVSGMRPGILSLQDEGAGGASNGQNVTPPVEGMQGPLGFWSFPILSKFTSGEGFSFKPSTKGAGLGTPSRTASRAAIQGTNTRDPERVTGIRPY